MTSIPKTIANHPAVELCETGEDAGSDYKWFVMLRPGWKFSCGTKADGTGGGFNSVKAFLMAKPIKYSGRIET